MSNKKHILVAGFGAMGCRHVQSLINAPEAYEITILELSENNISTNLARIGAEKESFHWIDSLDKVDDTIDLAIIATSSEPRFQIVKTLLSKGVKYFLLEKIVFQSERQFLEILDLLQSTGAKAYCNFVNRYFNAYNEIKQLVSGNHEINMVAYGGKFGMGCNSIHYIDVFQYLTANDNIEILHAQLAELQQENRRGGQYREFSGTITARNSNGKLQVISDGQNAGDVIIHITCDDKQFLLNEGTGKMFSFNGFECQVSPFIIQPTSKLTGVIVPEILDGTCRLTQLQDTFPAHKELFRHINNAVAGQHDLSTCCPIT